MIAALRAHRDAFLGRGDAAVTIPAMDGPLRANQRLDQGRVVLRAEAPDNLPVAGGAVLCTSGGTVFRMMAEIEEAFWIAPALNSGRSFMEPLQGGGVKHMAALNPWAPTRSYGLVARLDASLTPVASWHSRAGGAFHGVTSAAEHDGALLVSAKGGGAIVALDASDAEA